MIDLRKKRYLDIPEQRRKKPYIYEYELQEVAELLNIPTIVLQEMIHAKAEEYHLMNTSGSGR